MSILETIKSRRTTYQFLDKEVSREQINDFITAAIWAPNHRLTQPWKFWVIGEEMQVKLAKIFAHHRGLKKGEQGTVVYEEGFNLAIERFMSISQVVMVGQVIAEKPVTYKEDYAACSCAIQNFQLAAWEQKIGVQWSTGPILLDDKTYDLLGINRDKIELIGALYMGYPKCTGNPVRKSIEEVTIYTG